MWTVHNYCYSGKHTKDLWHHHHFYGVFYQRRVPRDGDGMWIPSIWHLRQAQLRAVSELPTFHPQLLKRWLRFPQWHRVAGVGEVDSALNWESKHVENDVRFFFVVMTTYHRTSGTLCHSEFQICGGMSPIQTKVSNRHLDTIRFNNRNLDFGKLPKLSVLMGTMGSNYSVHIRSSSFDLGCCFGLSVPSLWRIDLKKSHFRTSYRLLVGADSCSNMDGLQTRLELSDTHTHKMRRHHRPDGSTKRMVLKTHSAEQIQGTTRPHGLLQCIAAVSILHEGQRVEGLFASMFGKVPTSGPDQINCKFLDWQQTGNHRKLACELGSFFQGLGPQRPRDGSRWQESQLLWILADTGWPSIVIRW